MSSSQSASITDRSPSPSAFIVASETSSEDDEFEFVVDYKLFVKMANGTSLSAKWFQESVSTVMNEEGAERPDDYKNNNQVPSVSSLSVYDKEIAANVLQIRTTYRCNMHIRPCLNKETHKDLHIKITFMMLSIWASDIVMFVIVLY
ncbi:6823_t:CDS:2 [Racocetra fulgida]|uniref:6823_t:CDS:1 n=1 Tax=Racocetra fulgida TaxID=60492 RepID=A0A9N9CS33_9GLOM|nr:6823_t:CDS:2 [Racocetra fulgida]